MIEVADSSIKPVMRIYACGGMGVSVVQQFNKLRSGTSVPDAYANVAISFIDTSKSDLAGGNIDPSQVYTIDGLDGQGKLRGLNIDDIRSHIPSIMYRHEPGDINVVVHSGGGGSGSVLGPLITQQLMERGESVIPFVVGCTGSAIEADNTLGTLRSYANFVESMEMPLTISWHENKQGKPMSEVDSEVRFIIALLSVMYSGNNRKLDSADLRNWLDYTKVTKYGPELCSLKLHTGSSPLHDAASACSLLAAEEEPPQLEVPYHAYGYMMEEISQHLQLGKGRSGPVTLAVTVGSFDPIVKKLQQEVEKNKERMSIRKPSKLGNGGGGLVL